MFVEINCKLLVYRHTTHSNWLFTTYDDYSMINVVSVPESEFHHVRVSED